MAILEKVWHGRSYMWMLVGQALEEPQVYLQGCMTKKDHAVTWSSALMDILFGQFDEEEL